MHQEKGKKMIGRPRLRWRDYVKRDTEKADVEERGLKDSSRDRTQGNIILVDTCIHEPGPCEEVREIIIQREPHRIARSTVDSRQ